MKVRNLQLSHDYREYKKENPSGQFISRRRVFLPAPQTPKAKEREIEIPPTPPTKAVNLDKDAQDEEIERTRTARQEMGAWVQERRVLRKNLDKLGLNDSWMEHKSDKSEIEKRILKRMQKPDGSFPKQKEENFLLSKRRVRRISSAHVDFLPYVKTPLPIALALIADYLADHRLRLVDLFTKVDRNKDWSMTRDELKMAFKKIKVPLSDGQLDHLIFTLDVNNDNELSYKEVAHGVEAYHKDRRWQKMKKMYDNMIAIKEEDVTPNAHEQTDLLSFDWDVYNQPIIPKRLSLKHKPKGNDVIEDRYVTTMTGPLVPKKIEYLKWIDAECGECIKHLSQHGIFIQKDRLERFYRAPIENTEDKCEIYLSTNRSAFPFNHSTNVACRKNQRRVLKRIARREAIESRSGKNTERLSPEEMNNSNRCYPTDTAFLPRVASFKEICREGRKKRRQIENATPSPYWPQHLLDKLCLCMDKCHVGSDRKEVMFNLVKP